MIYKVFDSTGYWYICEDCGKASTFDHEWMRDEAVQNHVCVVVPMGELI